MNRHIRDRTDAELHARKNLINGWATHQDEINAICAELMKRRRKLMRGRKIEEAA
jgi:ribosome-associated translation inhibitor RaiA